MSDESIDHNRLGHTCDECRKRWDNDYANGGIVQRRPGDDVPLIDHHSTRPT